MGAKYPQKRPLSARVLAEMFKCDPSTVRRKMAQPRAEYEASSISRAQPWKSLGMSRTTWYRKGKPERLIGGLDQNSPRPSTDPSPGTGGDHP